MSDGTYVSFEAKLGKTVLDSEVNVVNFSNAINTTEQKMKSTWFSKFMGLYYKECQNKPFDDRDFDGKDIYNSLQKSREDQHLTNESSILPSSELQLNIQNTDRTSTAIFCLAHYINTINQKKVIFSKLIGETKTEQAMFCRNFRLSTLSLISNMFSLFNDVEYNKMANHVEMQFGKTSSVRDVQK